MPATKNQKVKPSFAQLGLKKTMFAYNILKKQLYRLILLFDKHLQT